MPSATLARRLPGVRFEVSQPAMDALPPMDVAVFVGFAASGPLHTPVAVQDAAQFAAIFGDDAPLAWDQERGEMIYAYLAPAVRAFFRNGGRRCWIVRVAREAQPSYVPIPGLVELKPDGTLAPAFARARSPGSWSDSVRLAAALTAQPVGLVWPPTAFPTVDLELSSPGDVAAGDLLRLRFDDGSIAMLPVQSVEPGHPASPPAGGTLVRAVAHRVAWFTAHRITSPPASPRSASLITPVSEDANQVSTVPVLEWPFSHPITDPLTDSIALTLGTPFTSVSPGSLIRVDCGDEQLWLMVQDVAVAMGSGSPPAEAVRVTGRALWKAPPPQPLPGSVPDAERLTFSLYAPQGAGQPISLTALGFQKEHPRFWQALPTDEALYRAGDVTNRYAALWQAAADPRFPFAGRSTEGDSIYLPIAMPGVVDQFNGPIAQRGTPLERDGLADFDAVPFLDSRLSKAGAADLMAQADFLRYQDPNPQPPYLRGIHAALGVEEATIIAVPDAVHRGWNRSGAGDALPPAPSIPFPHPEWWHFLDCRSSPPTPALAEPAWGSFMTCGVRVIPAPTIRPAGAPDNAGTFTLTWSGLSEREVRYVVEEATDPSFAGAIAVYSGPAGRLTIYGRAQGDYYYHARAVVKGQANDWSDALASDWSEGIGVRVSAGKGWYLRDAASYSDGALISTQRALLRLCAARGDMTAVLALPERYHEDDALTHVGRLRAPVDPLLAGDVRPLGAGEARAFSYAALYHPWLFVADDTGGGQTDVRMPPDGAVCGVMARRALSRDAWISPANQPLPSVVALTSPMGRERWLDLQQAQINVIRQEPHGFVSLSADTLSDDPDLRPINVRRLLILLRRLALRLGATYVFEPNDDAFQRLVQRGFESTLEQLFVRGAFSGNTPASAFQVVADSSVNTPASMDAGRFVVDIKVAPSLPMTFLTIRLVQTGSGAIVTEEG